MPGPCRAQAIRARPPPARMAAWWGRPPHPCPPGRARIWRVVPMVWDARRSASFALRVPAAPGDRFWMGQRGEYRDWCPCLNPRLPVSYSPKARPVPTMHGGVKERLASAFPGASPAPS